MDIVSVVNQVVDFCKNHWIDILAVIGAVDVILGIITKLTPFDWDDNIYSMLHGWIAKLLKKPV